MSLFKLSRSLGAYLRLSARSFTSATAQTPAGESKPGLGSGDNRPHISSHRDNPIATSFTKKQKLVESASWGYTMESEQNQPNQVSALNPASMSFIPGLTSLQPQSQPLSQPPSKPPKGPKAKKSNGRTSPANQTPGKASGGVPDPSPFYITQAFLDPFLLPEPRRILLVIDLNGTLLYRPVKRRPFHFTKRPHATEFLTYCLATFYVAIWSSARPQNVNKMVAQLLSPEQCERCVLIWGRDTLGLSPADYDNKVQVYKRLTRVWTDPRVMSSHPAADQGGKWDQTNTVLVDDSLEKGRSEPFNLLQLPEFSGLQTEPPNVLPQVHDYLNSLCHQGDISRHMRCHPFKLDPEYELP